MDMNLTPDLIEEGFAREIISKIQTMRKEAGFEVMDHIRIGYEGNDKIKKVFEKRKDFISNETLCDEITDSLGQGYQKDWNINGEDVKLSVEKL